MVIMLFGTSCVGKTSVGKKLAELINFDFFDLDDELKKFYNMTIEEFSNEGFRSDRDKKRSTVLSNIIENDSKNKVIAVSPIYYSRNFTKFLKRKDVLAIELQDSPQNIFERLVFYDENDNVYKDDEYKNKHKKYYIKDIKSEKTFYKQAFKHVSHKFFMNGKGITEVAEDLAKSFKYE